MSHSFMSPNPNACRATYCESGDTARSAHHHIGCGDQRVSAFSLLTLLPRQTSARHHSNVRLTFHTLEHPHTRTNTRDSSLCSPSPLLLASHLPLHRLTYLAMAEATSTPRINAQYLESYVGRNVTIVGKVTQLRGETAVIDADGPITVMLHRVCIELRLSILPDVLTSA